MRRPRIVTKKPILSSNPIFDGTGGTSIRVRRQLCIDMLSSHRTSPSDTSSASSLPRKASLTTVNSLSALETRSIQWYVRCRFLPPKGAPIRSKIFLGGGETLMGELAYLCLRLNARTEVSCVDAISLISSVACFALGQRPQVAFRPCLACRHLTSRSHSLGALSASHLAALLL